MDRLGLSMLNKKILGLLLLGSSAWLPCHGGELEDLQLIRRAYEDQLFLFVDDKADDFLNSGKVDLQGNYAAEVRELMIGALVERGAFDEALSRMEEIEEHSPRLTYFKARALFGAYVERGEQLPSEEKRPFELIESVLPYLEGMEKVMANYLRFQDLFEIGEAKKAAEGLKEIINSHQRFRYIEDVKFLYGRSLYNQPEGLFSQALDVFSDLALKYPLSTRLARYHFWQGTCYFEMNDLDRAETSFLMALNKSTRQDRETKVDVHYNLGWLYVAMGRLEDGTRQLEKVLLQSPEYSARYQASTRYKLASIRLMKKDSMGCRDVLGPILRSSDLQHEASLLAAQASMVMGHWEDAMEDLLHAEMSTANDIRLEARRLLGKIYVEMNDFETAEGMLKSLVQHEVPLDFRIDVQLQLVDLYFRMDDIYRAQNIYLELLVERSRKLDAMLHFKLARCAMRSNPVVECIFKRDQLLKDLNSGRISSSKFDEEKLDLEKRLVQVMSKVWIETAYAGTKLSKSEVLEILEKLSGVSLESKTEELKLGYLQDREKLPSDVGLESALYNAMVEALVKSFWDESRIPQYGKASESLMGLGGYYPALQVMNISRHLDHIINMDEESPYLALAYYEKARLYAQQSLTNDAVESLTHAIAHTAEPQKKSEYLIQLARMEIQLAKGIEGDPKTVNFKVKKAIDHLNDVAQLIPKISMEWVDLKFAAYRMLLDYDAAEQVLTDALLSFDDLPTVRRLEEQLISFYFSIGREIKSAQRRLVYAERLEGEDPTEAQRQRFDAALILFESKHGHQDGVTWLKKLAVSRPKSRWTFRAGLKCVDIAHRQGKTQEADNLLKVLLEEGKELELALRLEVQMAVGQQAAARDDHLKAAEAYQSVMEASEGYPAIKAKATIELGKALKLRDPSRAADVFLQFYYLFPEHGKSQVALFESCRLRARLLGATAKNERGDQLMELNRLVAKLEKEKDRKDLEAYISEML
jgi:tetratricopeptide (TPR) repeat protein